MNKVLKIGHRGAKGYVAENTLASFKKAIDLHCDAIELDVHLSSDGKVVVVHDETINRTTTGKGFVNKYSSDELKQFGIITLEEVLDFVNNYFLVNIELKSNDCAEKVMKIVTHYIEKKYWSHSNFIISSFNWDLLEVCNQLNSKIYIGVLTQDSIENAVTFAKKITAYSINPYFKLLNFENVQQMHKMGFKIFPWTVNSKKDINLIKSLHVDGIISDFPDRI